MTNKPNFQERVAKVTAKHRALVERKNTVNEDWDNGVYERWVDPVITREHIPLDWRFDFNPATNPYFLERLGVNATLNPAATYINGKYVMVVRMEGVDRKSIFAVAESINGVDNFVLRPEPVILPDTNKGVTNIYDMQPCASPSTKMAGFMACSVSSPKTPMQRRGTIPPPSPNAALRAPKS